MKRRDFIGLASASAALAAFPGLVSAKVDAYDGAVLRTGHIGTGRRGKQLLRLTRGLPGYEIGMICDTLPFQLDTARDLAGPGVQAVDDYRRLLDDPGIDVVFIATPFHVHLQPLLDALDAGKHVYCEKTLVKGHDQIAAARSVLENTSRIVQTGYQHRYSDHLQRIHTIVRSGAIGTISKVDCLWNRDGDWRRPVPTPEYERLINWRMYREYSGGLPAELSSHQMDILQWFVDSPPRHIMGTGGIDHWKDGRTTRDNTHVTVSHDNGVVATYSCMTTNDHGGFRMTFFGTEGTIVTSLTEAWVSEEPIADEMPEDVDGMSGATMALGGGTGRWIKLAKFNATGNAVAAFRESVLGNTTPAASGLKGLATSRTVQLSLDAMDNGTVETYQKDT